MMQSRSIRFLGIFIFLSVVTSAIAGITGKLAGTVKDNQSGEAIIGASVQIVGTTLGGVTDLDGYYYIINVPPGQVELTASSVGYQAKRQTSIRIQVDQTTTINFALQQTGVEMSEVVVQAERPIIEVDRTYSISSTSAEDLKMMPLTKVSETVDLQAGVVDGHFRGGRKGEVAYLIDGVRVVDAYSNEQGTEVNTAAVQELQVISGNFNAEYGQAMSGVVNIVTKEGNEEKVHGNVNYTGGGYFTNHSKQFPMISDAGTLDRIRDLGVTLSGPVIGIRGLNFFFDGRALDDGGWQFGEHRFNRAHQVIPSDTSAWINLPGQAAFVPSYGDGSHAEMNYEKRMYMSFKLGYQLTQFIRLTGTSILSNREYKEYDHDRRLTPDTDYTRYSFGRTNLFKISHTPHKSLFYDLAYANNYAEYKHYVFENMFDTRYANPIYNDVNPSYTLEIGGDKMQHFRRYTNTHQGLGNASWQATKIHFVKLGFELQQHQIHYSDITPVDTLSVSLNPDGTIAFRPVVLGPESRNNTQYDHFPNELAVYLQDKIELPKLVVNLGLRFDWFNPNASVPADPMDPDVYNPRRTYYRDSLTFDQREKLWWKTVDAKWQFSPRFGIAYPVSEKGVLHFAYGHFFQRPSYEVLYTNPGWKLNPGTELSTVMGNPDLKPEQTVSYEFGLQQEIAPRTGMQVSFYQRDIRNLVSTDKIIETYGNSRYAQYVNRDFGQVRGVLLAIDRGFSQNLSLGFDYTFQIAEGNASDRQDAYNASSGSNNRELNKQLVPLNWDRRHTLNLIVNYNDPTTIGVSAIGTIGSGLPYTTTYQGIRTAVENDGRKPTYYNLDLSIFRSFNISNRWSKSMKARVTLAARNVLDILNENNVYNDTGRATYTLDRQTAHEYAAINTLDELYTRPDYYSRPREVRLTIGVEF
ncbi:MAG: TonB-dependent receptor [bacterium]|nr:TonB-dependent receptor [bacterium]